MDTDLGLWRVGWWGGIAKTTPHMQKINFVYITILIFYKVLNVHV